MNHFESIVCQLSPSAIQADLVSLCQFCQSGSALLWRRPPTGRAARCILFFAATTGKLYGSAHRACRALVPWRTNFSILLETLVDLKDGCGNRLTEVRDRGKVQSRVQGVVQFLFTSILFLSKSASAEPAVCYPVDLSILGVRFHQTPRTVVAHRA